MLDDKDNAAWHKSRLPIHLSSTKPLPVRSNSPPCPFHGLYKSLDNPSSWVVYRLFWHTVLRRPPLRLHIRRSLRSYSLNLNEGKDGYTKVFIQYRVRINIKTERLLKKERQFLLVLFYQISPSHSPNPLYQWVDDSWYALRSTTPVV